MLSLITCYSMLAAIPVYVFSQAFVDNNDWLLARCLPKHRPRIWVFMLVFIVLTVDFALLPVIMGPFFVSRLYIFDTAVLLGPLLYGSLRKHSLFDTLVRGGAHGTSGHADHAGGPYWLTEYDFI